MEHKTHYIPYVITILLTVGVLLPLVSAGPISPTIISDPIKTIVCTFAKALIWIGASLAALVFALAGVQWIYAQDDASKRKAARDTMIHCVIGLIIIALANNVVKDLVGYNCGDWSAWT